MDIGFDPPLEDPSSLRRMKDTAVRLLGVEELIYDDGNYYSAAVYEVFDAINMEMGSSLDEDIEPIKLGFSIVGFDGELAKM